MEIKVGDRFDWETGNDADNIIITKIEGDKAWFRCNDGYEGDCTLDEVRGWLKIEDTSPIIPTHYNSTKIDALSVIDDWNLSFRLGNTIKYIQRHLLKGKPVEDLEKAANYLQLEIKRLKDANNS